MTGLQSADGIGLHPHDMLPLVSIAIPTFDRPAYLKEAVVSALGQTYPNVEVLIGDNGSEDAMRDWDTEIVSDPRLCYRRNPRNLGMCGNFNALADAARGEFFTAIGDDDRLLPDFATRLAEAMKPGVDLAFCNHYLIDSRGERLESQTRIQTQRYKRDRLTAGVVENAQIAAWQQSIAMSATLMRTEHMRRLRFREDLNAPDSEFFIRLAHKGARFAFVPDYLAEYRVHGAATSAAGLCSERLVEYLLPFEVPTVVEPYKRELLAPLIMNAVSRCLGRGERERARKLLQSPYYPRRLPADSTQTALATPPKAIHSGAKRFAEATEHVVKFGLQHFCASLPTAIGSPTYRAVRAAKDWARS
jgi:glycosyltransferase involved in cell wall biosynthesis